MNMLVPFSQPPVLAVWNLYFFSSFGLKKLVNLFILLVLTFLSDSTPLDAGGAFRLVPLASFPGLTIGCWAARTAAARFERYSSREAKSYDAVKADVTGVGRYWEMWSMIVFILAAGLVSLRFAFCTYHPQFLSV